MRAAQALAPRTSRHDDAASRRRRVADIFVSYTSSDRNWAHWIGLELEKLGHAPHVHEWEIPAGGNIAAWMEERHHKADHILCVISKVYLTKDYSTWERQAAQWAAATKRPNFALPVFVEECEAPTLLAPFKRCDLHGLSEGDARARLAAYLAPAAKPTGPVPFPAEAKAAEALPTRPDAVTFPGGRVALSNVPITVPRHFLGRDDALEAIDAALKRYDGRVAITALHGLRGVGKTTLAAAYCERRRAEYRATWWIRAQAESTTRADLAALGVRLGWVAADDKEEPALEKVRERLRNEGEGLLLVYDNAIDSASLKSYLPLGGAARVLVTSNAHAWRGVAAPVEIRLWPKEIGADYLIARTGRDNERAGAQALSQALGGLPLAHEQAAAYCERLDVSLGEYRKRFETAPARLLDAAKDAPAEYHDHLTVAKSFALAIDEVAKLHPAAEPLIVHAALLAPESIPLFLFSEGREKFAEPLASQLADDGLEEAAAALRAFALVDRETIPDERDPAIVTETIRLHQLVRAVAADRRQGEAAEAARRVLIEAMAAVYPRNLLDNAVTWPRARRLDALALDLVGGTGDPPSGVESGVSHLLGGLGSYRLGALAAYSEARPFFERAVTIRERRLGSEHPDTAESLNDLAILLKAQGDLASARPLYERALAIREKALGPEHPDFAESLGNLAVLLQAQGDFAGARPLFDRALAIRERALGPEHPTTAYSIIYLASLLQAQGDLAGARSRFERALAIREKALGPADPATATSLNDLGRVLQAQGDLAGARPLYERSLAIREKALGAEHPYTATSLNNLALVFEAQGDLAGARPLYERSLAIDQKALGAEHPETATCLDNLAQVLQAQGDLAGARPLYERALAIREKVLGPNHSVTATSLNNLGTLLLADGDLAGARPLIERALAIDEKALGPEHSQTATKVSNLARVLRDLGEMELAERMFGRAIAVGEKTLGPAHSLTQRFRSHYARLLLMTGRSREALSLGEAALAVHETANGPNHPWTKDSAGLTAAALDALDRADEAAALRAKYGLGGGPAG
jgi:Tfp pilus assembly protein PilF